MVYDAIVIGSGAAGGWVAMDLSKKGMKVLVLEAGPAVDWEENSNLPASFGEQIVQSASANYGPQTHAFYINDKAHPFDHANDKPYNWIRSRTLGGRTNVWSRVMLRMDPEDFASGSVDGHGIAWPMPYHELLPHYDRVERYFDVQEEMFFRALGSDFTRGTSPSKEFLRLKEIATNIVPEANTRHLPRISRGTVLPTPFGIRAATYSSTASTLLDAIETGNTEVRTNTTVSSLLVSNRRQGAIAGVEFVGTEDLSRGVVEGRIVVLCASTLESTRILLNSADQHHPNGAGNSSGTLGHFLCDHFGGVAIDAISDGNSESGESWEGILIPPFRNRGRDKRHFLRSYNVQGHLMQGPGGRRLKLKMMGEALSHAENSVTLDPHKTDRWGMPILKINCAYGANEVEMAEDAASVLTRILQELGYNLVSQATEVSIPGTRAHELGTARMGSVAINSVLNAFGQSWDHPNLFILDGSSFPSAGSQNPTLTMMALASRAVPTMIQQARHS